ncbi:MAG: tyrosine-type recombinase/integrase [archaeon]|nr:MAG: tyrosine-type recombinase/integrase [archaeon]
MEQTIDIHHYAKKLEATIKRIKESDISKKNKEILMKFQDACIADGIGKAKIARYLYDLRKITEIVVRDLDKCNQEDIQHVLAVIEKKDYAYNTKRGFRIILKKFYKWLRNAEDIYPEEVRWIKTTADSGKQRLPEDLLNEEDILKLIQNSNKSRDKAFIACLYESGCRIGELATIKIKNVSFDEFGAKISVFGKTGSRYVRLISSSGYLLNWINDGHPDNHNPESFVWLSQKNNLITYARIKNILKNAKEKAGVRKRVNPHSFRHARATYLAKHLSDAQLKSVMGWKQGSKMAAVYVHLSQRDTDDAILELNGIQREKKEKSKIEIKECGRCKHRNKPTSLFCEMCGMILDQEEANKIVKADLERNKINELMNNLVKDKEFMDLLKKKLFS